MRRWMRALVALAALMAASGAALAQAPFPARPVHLLVPFPPGGAVDIVARTLGDELSKRWGQPVVVENRAGAGGTIAAAAAAKAAPDGYTIILVASGHAIVSYLYPDLPYDPVRDFTPLSLVGSSPNMMLVRADSQFKTIADVLAFARKNPGQLSYGYPGNGTSPHLAGELLKYMAKVAITPVPYKGGAPVLNDLLGGHIPLSFNNIPEFDRLRAGRQAAAARHDDGGALAGAARRAHHRRSGAPRLRHRRVVGISRARRPAGRREGKACQGLRRSRTRSGRARSPVQARRHADRGLVGGFRQADRVRAREVGTDHQGCRHQGRVTRDKNSGSCPGRSAA